MDQTGLNFLIFLFVLGPLLIFFVKNIQAAGPAKKAIEADDSNLWKDPASYLVNVPSEMVTKIVSETLPQFHYANGNWQIINIEPGMPTTIAANLPCLDESDPDNVQRFDLGLITTIIDQSASGQATRVKMHFIPYEGLDGGLEEMSRRTYTFIQKALKAQDGLMQPLVVQGNDDSLPSDGAPAERATNFFVQSAAPDDFEKDGKGGFESGSRGQSSDIDTGDLDVVPSLPEPKWQQASVPEFMPDYHEPGSASVPEKMPDYREPAPSFASEFMPDYHEPAPASAPDFSNVPEMTKAPDFSNVPEMTSVPDFTPVPEMTRVPDFASVPDPAATADPLAFLNQGPAFTSMSAPLFEPAPFEIPPAPIMPASLPPAMPAPLPPPMPSGYPSSPSVYPPLPSGAVAGDDLGTAAGAGGGSTAGLCPGCSQPINPSFPFCLYCGKNF